MDAAKELAALGPRGARYSELTYIGSGAYGVVYAARDNGNQSVVAIKFLQPDKATRYMEFELVNHST